MKSPIYCDNRKTLSYPKIRTYIRQQFTEIIKEQWGEPDVIAGVATGGIALGALVAEEMGLPFVYVRSSAKAHGLGNQIEGVLEKGQRVMVIEDLVSTGKSSLNAVDALREVGAQVMGMVAIFSYGFDVATTNMEAAKCQLETLTDYNILIQQAVAQGYAADGDLTALHEWRNNPKEWSKKLEETS